MPRLAESLAIVLWVLTPAGLAAEAFAPREEPLRAEAGVRGESPAKEPAEPTAPVSRVATGARAPVKISPRKSQPSVPLAPRGNARNAARSTSPFPSLLTLVGSLGVVVGLFLGVVWLIRRGMPAGAMVLPREAVEVLGRAALGGRQQAYLVRCGNKLLLVSVSPAGCETLTEIIDPLEVDRLAGLCQQSQPQSATAAFRQVFQQFAGERATPGFLGESHRDNIQLAAANTAAEEDDDV
ncbi:MAG: flagellar biosynthetic protein FliO [Pirellulales bacterium]